MIVFVEGKRYEIKEPSSATLKKYGLSLNDWKEILTQQGYKCPICKRVLEKTTNIDHYHVRHWKQMTPENRKLYVRGVTCWFDNKNYMAKGITIEKSKAVTEYLENFEKKIQSVKK